MTKMTKQEAMAALASKVIEFQKSLREAENIADEYDLSFHISPAYGMGGTYEGEEDSNDVDHGWNPSSQSC